MAIKVHLSHTLRASFSLPFLFVAAELEKERLSKFREEMPLPSAPLGPHGGGEQNGKEAVSKKVLGAADGAEEKKVAYQVCMMAV